jgi:hypothetical protein
MNRQCHTDPGLRRLPRRRAEAPDVSQAALTAATSLIRESLASPKSMVVLGS